MNNTELDTNHTTQDRQKHWADMDRRSLKFDAGEHVFLRISLTKRVIRFGLREKLSPKYIGSFEILKRVRELAYRLALSPSLKGVHNVLHVSQLRRYVRDESHGLDYSELELQPDLSDTEQPIVVLDRSIKTMKNRTISLILVSWNRHNLRETT